MTIQEQEKPHLHQFLKFDDDMHPAENGMPAGVVDTASSNGDDADKHDDDSTANKLLASY